MPRKRSDPDDRDFWRQKPTLDLDDLILKHLSKMSGEQVDKENMVRGIASILIQAVGRLEKMDLREDLMGQEWLRIERRIRRLEAHCGIAHEDGDDE